MTVSRLPSPATLAAEPAGATLRSEPDAASATNFRELLSVIAARRLWIVATTVAALAVAFGYLAVAKPLYTATVSVLIDARPRAPLGSDAVLPQSAPDATLVESQVKLIVADAVLRRVVAAENLAADPDFGTPAPGLRTRLMAALTGHKAAPQGDTTANAVGALARTLTVRRSERTYVMDVDVATGDAAKSARLANAVAAAYIADQQSAAGDTAERDNTRLDARLRDLQTRLTEAETKVARYRADNRILDTNGKSVGEQAMADVASDLGRARGRAADEKSRNDQVQALVRQGRLADITADAARSATLDKLRTQYAEIVRQQANLRTTLGERHPALREGETQLRDVRTLITDELKRVAQSSANDYAVAQASADAAARRYDDARRALDTQNQATVKLRDLERDAEASRVAYERFLRARESQAPADSLSTRVIAPAAVPLSPSSPKTLPILVAALAGGVFAGIGLVLAADYAGYAPKPAGSRRRPVGFWRRPTKSWGFPPRSWRLPTMPRPRWPVARRSSPESAGGPAPVVPPRDAIIAAVPRVRQGSWRDGLRDWVMRPRRDAVPQRAGLLDEVARHPGSPFSTAIASIYDALSDQRVGLRSRVMRSVLLTSATPGVGRTTIAANVARVAAEAGERVLLVDAETSQPGLQSLLGSESRAGLIELFGETRVLYGLGGVGAGRLDLVPVVDHAERIVRRLAHRHVRRIAAPSDHYDLVLIDGPSYAAPDDLRRMARLADRIVVVREAGTADALPLADLLRELALPDHRFGGTILSMAEARSAA